MSTIKVWTSDGNWSEGVDGCDKVHLMKVAIMIERDIAYENCNGKWLDYNDLFNAAFEHPDGTITHGQIHHSGLQIDNKTVDLRYLLDDNWNIDFKCVELKNASFFKMRLSTLRKMAEENEIMSAVYNELIERAKVPEKAPKSFFLLFMFSDE